MKYILIILFISVNSAIFCQNTDCIETPLNYSGLNMYLRENLIYPEYAYKNKISGRVHVCFTVDANRWVKKHVTNVHVTRSVHPSLDFAAISMVQSIPDIWGPPPRGTYDTVRIVYTVKFDIETVKPEQISDCFDQKINELLAMDSSSLYSILYKDKPVNRELYVPPVLAKNYNRKKISLKPIKINGTIFDFQDNSPIPMVQIMEISTTNSAISDYNGDFTLSINKKSEVKISYPGYMPQTFKFRRSKSDLKIYLQKDVSTLQEFRR